MNAALLVSLASHKALSLGAIKRVLPCKAVSRDIRPLKYITQKELEVTTLTEAENFDGASELHLIGYCI